MSRAGASAPILVGIERAVQIHSLVTETGVRVHFPNGHARHMGSENCTLTPVSPTPVSPQPALDDLPPAPRLPVAALFSATVRSQKTEDHAAVPDRDPGVERRLSIGDVGRVECPANAREAEARPENALECCAGKIPPPVTIGFGRLSQVRDGHLVEDLRHVSG